MHWARSWSRWAIRWLSHPPAVGCHYFLPCLQSASQLKNVTILSPVPSYTLWWQRHISVNNLPEVVMQLCPGGNWTHDTTYWLQVQLPTAMWCIISKSCKTLIVVWPLFKDFHEGKQKWQFKLQLFCLWLSFEFVGINAAVRLVCVWYWQNEWQNETAGGWLSSSKRSHMLS